MHLNAFYDLQGHTYTDALIQPVHFKDEYRAFCSMVDRYVAVPGHKTVFIGDRGYCAYNNIVHVLEKDSISFSVQRTFIPKGWCRDLIFPVKSVLISRWMLPLYAAIQKAPRNYGI